MGVEARWLGRAELEVNRCKLGEEFASVRGVNLLPLQALNPAATAWRPQPMTDLKQRLQRCPRSLGTGQ